MYTSGEGDILALKDHLSQEWDDVYFGFVYKVENGKSYYTLIMIVLETISRVKWDELSDTSYSQIRFLISVGEWKGKSNGLFMSCWLTT